MALRWQLPSLDSSTLIISHHTCCGFWKQLDRFGLPARHALAVGNAANQGCMGMECGTNTWST